MGIIPLLLGIYIKGQINQKILEEKVTPRNKIN